MKKRKYKNQYKSYTTNHITKGNNGFKLLLALNMGFSCI